MSDERVRCEKKKERDKKKYEIERKKKTIYCAICKKYRAISFLLLYTITSSSGRKYI